MDEDRGTALWLALGSLAVIFIFILAIWLGGTEWVYDIFAFFTN